MSFLKIADPAKRDQIVKEYLATRKRIRDSQLAERTGDIELQTDLSKFFKPITETQKAATKEITEELKPIKEGIKDLPNAITFPTFSSIKAYEKSEMNDAEREELFRWIEELEKDEDPFLLIGPLAQKQLRRFTNKDEADTTYGLYDKKGKFYIGNQEFKILGDDFLIANKTYVGTPGLWELIVAKRPDESIYGGKESKDFKDYREIMLKSNTLHRNNDPTSNFPKSSKAYKWTNILSNIWNDEILGRGIVVIPSDPNALLKRLDLLMASKEAGNTGVRNELVSICDELKRQGILNSKSYKNLISTIK